MSKNKKPSEDEESKVVVATSNMELLNEVFKEGGLPSFEEQFAKLAEVMAKEYKGLETVAAQQELAKEEQDG
jgi:hypothetical protein